MPSRDKRVVICIAVALLIIASSSLKFCLESLIGRVGDVKASPFFLTVAATLCIAATIALVALLRWLRGWRRIGQNADQGARSLFLPDSRAVIVPLACAVVVLLLWVLSYPYTLDFSWARPRSVSTPGNTGFVDCRIQSASGRIGVSVTVCALPITASGYEFTRSEMHWNIGSSRDPWSKIERWPKMSWARAGFHYGYQSLNLPASGRTGEIRQVALPYWFILLLAALWAGRRVVSRERRLSRIARGLCPTCGYDIRACAERCSECGTFLSAEPHHRPQMGAT